MTVVVRDVQLVRAVGWLCKLVQKSTRDNGRKQAARTLNKMIAAADADVANL